MSKLPIPFGNPATYPGHSGVDYGQRLGTAFLASGPGRVRNLGKNARGGFYIWVEYDSGPVVGYHHMDSWRGCPSPGARVTLGTRLGYVGNTGNSTGPHLHSEVEGRASTFGYWQVFDRSRTVAAALAPSPTPAAPNTEEDDMPIAILEIKDDSSAAKSLYDVKTGKAGRMISKDENSSFRLAQASGAVVYVSVSRADYKARGGK